MLDIDWLFPGWPTEATEGYGETKLGLDGLARFQVGSRRPYLVFIDEDREEDEALDIVKRLFGDEEVVIATKVFNCYRIPVSQIPEGELAKTYGRRTPALYFFDQKGNEVDALIGKKKPDHVQKRLEKMFEGFYVGDFEKWVESYADALDAMQTAEDKWADARKFLEPIVARVAKDDSPKKSLLEDLAEAEKKVDEAKKTFDEARKALNALTLLERADATARAEDKR